MAKAKVWGYPDKEEIAKGLVGIICPGCKTFHAFNVFKADERGNQWGFNNDFDKPTFTPSLLIRTGKFIPGNENWDDEGHPEFNTICHSFITNGMIQFLGDCTHHLKGQTVELPNIES